MKMKVQIRRDIDTIRRLTEAGVSMIGHGVDMNTHSRRNGDVVFTYTYPARLNDLVKERVSHAQDG